MGIFSEFTGGLAQGYKSILGAVPTQYGTLLNVFVFAILISIYSIFSWKFYRFLSKKDLISLNLSKYNRTSYPFLKKFFALILYFVEYIIVLPFLIFFWFAILSLIIIVLSEEQAAINILVVAAAIVAAIRMLSYYQEDLSKDLAKMFPFTILTIFILSPGFFSVERVLARLSEIPSLFVNVFYFLALIIIVELVFRFLDMIMRLFRGEEQIDAQAQEVQIKT